MAKKSDITAEYVQSNMVYNHNNGTFYKNNKKLGSEDEKGYIRIGINWRHYRAHRLAWLYVYGEWPNGQIDHINGDRSDNRIENLRIATNGQNQHNKRIFNKIKGISVHKKSGKWHSRIMLDKKHISLGLYDCPAAASFAYQIASDKYHGEFGRGI